MEPKNETQEVAQEVTTTSEEATTVDVEGTEEPTLEERVRELVTRLVTEELETACAEAYRRGRNDRIATLTHDLPTVADDSEDPEETNPVPHFVRRSIWDC